MDTSADRFLFPPPPPPPSAAVGEEAEMQIPLCKFSASCPPFFAGRNENPGKPGEERRRGNTKTNHYAEKEKWREKLCPSLAFLPSFLSPLLPPIS